MTEHRKRTGTGTACASCGDDERLMALSHGPGSDGKIAPAPAGHLFGAEPSLVEGIRANETMALAGARDRPLLRVVNESSGSRQPEATRVGNLYGWSAAMLEIFALIQRAAATDATVFIEGETGCGKDLCAEAIHLLSGRAQRPFVIADMGAIAPSLIESELFGHVRGAFTGAIGDRTGAFATAHGGTLFLDEIGELDLDLQPRLLRALEQRRVKPVGSTHWTGVDLRIIAATSRSLETEVREKRFRADLFYRLSVVRIRLPPLRQRPEDTLGLARLFLGERDVDFSPEAFALLVAHDWPGNVRELKNAVARSLACLKAGERVIGPAMLALDSERPEASGLPPASTDFVASRDRAMAAWERSFLTRLLERCRGNVTRAARECGIDRVYFHRLMRRHSLKALRTG